MTENYNYEYIQNTPQEIYTTNDDINQLLNQYPTTTDYTTTYQSPQNYTVIQKPQKVKNQQNTYKTESNKIKTKNQEYIYEYPITQDFTTNQQTYQQYNNYQNVNDNNKLKTKNNNIINYGVQPQIQTKNKNEVNYNKYNNNLCIYILI